MILKNAKVKDNWPMYLVILGYSAYIIHVLLPTVSTRFGSIFAISALLIAYFGIFFDREVTTKKYAEMLLYYMYAGVFSFFMWWIGRKEHTTFTIYMVRAFMLWSPVMIANYLKVKQNKKANTILALVVIGSIAITCFTTLFRYNQYPYASRVLSGGGNPDLILRFRKMNIGGYGFIYMLALSIPLMIASFNNAKRAIAKLTIGAVLIAAVVTIVLSQYLIAFYMLILSISTIIIFHLICWFASLVKGHIINRTVIMGLSAVVALLVFVLNISSINNGLKDYFEKLDLSLLTLRTETISSLRTPLNTINPLNHSNEEKQGAGEKTEEHRLNGINELPDTTRNSVSSSEGNTSVESSINGTKQSENSSSNNYASETTDVDLSISNEANTSNPLSGRMSYYRRPVETFMKSPITGNLFGQHISLSEHSEFGDALLGGGVAGAALVVALLYSIFCNLFRDALSSSYQPFLVLMLLMLLGLGTLNTLTYSREIFLLFILAPYFMLDGHKVLDDQDAKKNNETIGSNTVQ